MLLLKLVVLSLGLQSAAGASSADAHDDGGREGSSFASREPYSPKKHGIQDEKTSLECMAFLELWQKYVLPPNNTTAKVLFRAAFWTASQGENGDSRSMYSRAWALGLNRKILFRPWVQLDDDESKEAQGFVLVQEVRKGLIASTALQILGLVCCCCCCWCCCCRRSERSSASKGEGLVPGGQGCEDCSEGVELRRY